VSDYVRIELLPDSDGSGEFSIEYSISGFSARSSAWFDLNDLEKKVERFLDYPLPADNLPCLRGGYWNQDATNLDFEHVFYLFGQLGIVGRLCSLSDVQRLLQSRNMRRRAAVDLLRLR
jgi:hypothetical protein